MAHTATYLAYDLGASSGRAVVGRLDGARIALEEIHRFSNGPIPVSDGLYWDVLRLFQEMMQGLRRCVQACGKDLMGIGIDTWGVDFALLDGRDDLLGNPRCYRDARVQGMMEKAFDRVPREEIFDRTAVQFLEINTLYHLLAMSVRNAPQLQIARTFLMMPDLFNFWLTGRKVCEFSNATTTQFYDPRREDWAVGLLRRMEIPTDMLPRIVPPGTSLGTLRPAIADEAAFDPPKSSPRPVTTPARLLRPCPCSAPTPSTSAAALGADGRRTHPAGHHPGQPWPTTSPTKAASATPSASQNISGPLAGTGMQAYLVARRPQFLLRRPHPPGLRSPPLAAFGRPDHADFFAPGDMPARIRAFCKRTGQPEPDTEGAVVRCTLESLALKFRHTLDQLEQTLAER